MNSPANCPNWPFQDIEFDPPSLDRKGHPIDYQPPCLVSRIGSTAPSLKKLMKTHAAPMIVTYQSSKRKAVQGTTQKAITGKRLRRTRPSAAQVNNPYSFQTDVQLLIPFFIVINHCVPIYPGCGAAILGVWFSANWTFIGWFSQGVDFSGNNQCSHNNKNYETFPFYHWCSLEHFLKSSWFYSISILHLIPCHVRYFLRKHLCRSRSLTVSLLKTILPWLISKLLIPRFSTQVMVRKSYA